MAIVQVDNRHKYRIRPYPVYERHADSELVDITNCLFMEEIEDILKSEPNGMPSMSIGEAYAARMADITNMIMAEIYRPVEPLLAWARSRGFDVIPDEDEIELITINREI